MKLQIPPSLPLLCVAITLLLSACAKAPISPAEETSHTPLQIAQLILESQTVAEPLSPLSFEDDSFSPYLTGFYQLDPQWIEDGMIYYSQGAQADEVAVLLLSADAPLDQVQATLLDYLQYRAAAFTGYAPAQAALADNGIVISKEQYVILLICQDPAAAQEAVRSCFADITLPPVPDCSPSSEKDPEHDLPAPAQSPVTPEKEAQPPNPAPPPSQATPTPPPSVSQPPPVPPPDAAEEYDHAGILAAYRSGDSSALSDQNREILTICTNVIADLIVAHQADWEKELAIHDWILAHAEYDPEALSQSPDASPHPQNHTPYGLLVDGRAICLGYTTTFQLFMDLLNIECLSVSGTAHNATAEHAWNMVRLDGEWYCVDLTWNDPVGFSGTNSDVSHRFFNVTSSFLRSTDHQWDESLTPVAVSSALSWSELNASVPDDR